MPKTLMLLIACGSRKPKDTTRNPSELVVPRLLTEHRFPSPKSVSAGVQQLPVGSPCTSYGGAQCLTGLCLRTMGTDPWAIHGPSGKKNWKCPGGNLF